MTTILHPRPVLILDAGGSYVQTVARAIRAERYYCEIVPALRAVQESLEHEPGALIVCAPEVIAENDEVLGNVADEFLDTGLPLLAIGEVQARVAMVATKKVAATAMATEFFPATLRDFLADAEGLSPEWTAPNIRFTQIQAVREQVGDARLICGLSGGVDSAVAAAIVQEAVGDQLTCVFVDHGLLRAGEREQVERDFVAATGVRLVTVDAVDEFLTALAGVTDPETKRKIIGERFIRVFEKAARDIAGSDGSQVKYLVQGTIYPDIVESGVGTAGLIKSHHNVGGLPDDLQFDLVEPLRLLFKDEVRAVGTELGLPDSIVHRHPFPGPGLGVRLVGAITRERLDVLRAADKIVRDEMAAAGADRDVWQCPVILLADVRSVGVKNGQRSYGMPVVLRPVLSQDAMTADWARLDYDLLAHISERITAEVSEVTRVVLDVTRKPPGTIEWE